jgi:hypothetical protein
LWQKKDGYVQQKHDLYPSSVYTHIPHIYSRVPFNPFWNHFIKPQNYLLTKFFMSKKYIQDSMMLTKEAFIETALRQQQSQATEYGLTLEEYQQAIASGSVVQAKSQSDI